MFGVNSKDNLPDTFASSHKAWDVYMADIWCGLFKALDIKENATVIEIAPGNSIKVGLALQQTGFSGSIYLVDPIKEILAESEELYRDIFPEMKICPVEATLADAAKNLPVEADFIVSNHPIDDMIMATTQPQDKLRELFDWTAIEHEQAIPISQQNWSSLEKDISKLEKVKNGIYEEWCQAIDHLKPKHCLVSQYPSITLKNNGMNGLNRHASEIFMRIRKNYTNSLIPDTDIQEILNRNENYNDVHIGTEVLNAKNWLVIRGAA